jgi:hypothetical protein
MRKPISISNKQQELRGARTRIHVPGGTPNCKNGQFTRFALFPSLTMDHYLREVTAKIPARGAALSNVARGVSQLVRRKGRGAVRNSNTSAPSRR